MYGYIVKITIHHALIIANNSHVTIMYKIDHTKVAVYQLAQQKKEMHTIISRLILELHLKL